MDEAVIKVGYDVKKMPLGELSKETALKGMAYLKQIEEDVNNE